jgi:hypothetical protein
MRVLFADTRYWIALTELPIVVTLHLADRS